MKHLSIDNFNYILVYDRPFYHLCPKTEMVYLVYGPKSHSPERKKVCEPDRSLCPLRIQGTIDPSKIYSWDWHSPRPLIVQEKPADRKLCSRCLDVVTKIEQGIYTLS